MGALRGERIEGQGVDEAQWAASRQLAALKSVTPDALLGDAKRLVVVAPHPDDEVLGCGGFMALAHQAGLHVLVISVTDGEAAYPTETAWPPERLARVRQAELITALAALGIAEGNIARLDAGDGEIGGHASEVAMRLAQIFVSSDLVLVTYSRDGHPDHEACADAAADAASRCGARLVQYPVWAWHWDDPENSSFLDAAVRLPLPEATHQAKSKAIEAFESQTGRISPAPSAPILPPWALARFQRPFEVFIR